MRLFARLNHCCGDGSILRRKGSFIEAEMDVLRGDGSAVISQCGDEWLDRRPNDVVVPEEDGFYSLQGDKFIRVWLRSCSPDSWQGGYWCAEGEMPPCYGRCDGKSCNPVEPEGL